jgi:uroporphyrinogen decarboxylase
MTPRERILAALNHKTPDRIPFAWGFGPTGEMHQCLTRELTSKGIDWTKLYETSTDVISVDPRYVGPKLPPHQDIWGIVRKPMAYEGGAYEEIAVLPLAGTTSVEALAAFPWPDPDAYAYDEFRAEVEKEIARRGPKAVRVFGGNPFEIYCWMTGLEEALTNLLTEPEIVRAALDRIIGFFERRLERLLRSAGSRADMIFYGDDVGTQNGPLLSPATYRAVIQPFHRRLLDVGKKFAPHTRVLFHSDGSVTALLPDLMDAGVDILEALQLECADMEPQKLKERFGDRLCFHGGISVQQLLPHATPEVVRAECRRLVNILGKNGGYIAAPSHAIQMGTPVENVLAMLEAVLGEKDYAAALAVAALR